MTRMYIICPSYAAQNPAGRAKALKTAKTWADAMGWTVTASPLLERYQQSGVWLPVEDRAEDLARALEYDIVSAFCGGYSAIQLVPHLLKMETARRPLLIGYSDITVLHACWRVNGWGPTLYGTFSEQIEDSRQGESMRAFLRGEAFTVSHEREGAAKVLRSGSVRAPIFAACLVVLASLCGTPAFPDLRGQILAIEDIDERPYAIDGALTQMYLAGNLEGIVGLVSGSFHHTSPFEYGGPTADEILAKWGAILNVPTIVRLPFGHMDDPLVLLSSVDAELEAQTNGHWHLHWPQRDPLIQKK